MFPEDYSFKILRASSPTDFLFLRKLRNGVSQNMTNMTNPLSIWDQVKFYLNRPPNIEIYIASVGGQRSAYLLLCDKGNSCFITEAVAEKYRNKGLALALISFAKTLRPVLVADILATNHASKKLHEKAGFFEISQHNNIIRYQYNVNV
jgi:hypothetical protein